MPQWQLSIVTNKQQIVYSKSCLNGYQDPLTSPIVPGRPPMTRSIAIRQRILLNRSHRSLPIPRHPTTTLPPQNWRRNRIWRWSILVQFIRINAIKLCLAPALGQSARTPSRPASTSPRQIILFTLKSLNKSRETLSLRRKIVQFLVITSDVLGNNPAGADTFSLTLGRRSIQSTSSAQSLRHKTDQVGISACGGHIEPRQKALRITCLTAMRRTQWPRSKTQKVNFHPLNRLIDIQQSRTPRALMDIGN